MSIFPSSYTWLISFTCTSVPIAEVAGRCRHVPADHELVRAARKAEVLNWTLHHLATYIAPNLRLDQIANAQAAFTRQGR